MVMTNVENDKSEFAQGALKLLKRQCPLSVKSTFYALNEVQNYSSIEECLKLEFRFVRCKPEGKEFLRRHTRCGDR